MDGDVVILGRTREEIEQIRPDIEEVLVRDPEVIRVYWPEILSFGEIDLSLWSKRAEVKESHIHLVEHYLVSPYVEDTFGVDAVARKAWVGRFPTTYESALWQWYKDSDALRYNRISCLGQLTQFLLNNYIGDNFKVIQADIHRVQELVPKTSTEYHPIPVAEKLTIVENLKDAMYTVLKHFYKPGTFEEK